MRERARAYAATNDRADRSRRVWRVESPLVCLVVIGEK